MKKSKKKSPKGAPAKLNKVKNKPKKKCKARPSSKNNKKPVAKKPATGKKKTVKRTPKGRTLKTKDKYLPQTKGKVKELKEKRWVVVIDSNERNELAIVRLTDEKQENTTVLPTYKKGNNRTTYFKHFVEITDNEGKPITVTKQGKFQENPSTYDLTRKEMSVVREKVLKHTKQASENQKKVEVLRNQDKNKR